MVQTLLPRTLPGYNHIKRYWDYHNNHCVAKILPGEYYITRHNEILMTVVGSCVAACIRDNVNNIGGMNHFMLPHIAGDKWERTGISAATRYGSFAMEYLINEILKYGGQRENLEIKLFGGGQIMMNMANIGQKNIEFVKEYIKTEGLTLLAEDLGDIYPRKILFYPVNGRVRVKKLRAMEQMIFEREKAYQRQIKEQPIAGEVDLF
jgi:chemotaxis protein CheD